MAEDRVQILTIIGARPQFVKAAMVSRAIQAHARTEGGGPTVAETILHTGQHFDAAMSQVFFDELGIPAPAVNLGIHGGSHGAMTGAMLPAIEAEIQRRAPDWVLVYGDTNSTLAGALAAAKLGVPVAHVEAGLRSFNRRMPEEINRVLTDHLAARLFCPTAAAVAHLRAEGVSAGVEQVGDVMYDAALYFGAVAEARAEALARHATPADGYALATVHRAENTDDPERLAGILQALAALHRDLPVVLPLHPRTRQAADAAGLGQDLDGLLLLPPVSFLEMVLLEKRARLILTDSGGIQKEAYFHGVPCVTLRDETEWTETVEAGWNRLAGARPEAIGAAVAAALHDGEARRPIPDYGAGNTAERIVTSLAVAPRSAG